MTEIECYVTDTSVLIERVVSKMIKGGEIKGRVIIPTLVIAELENQANKGFETGFIGLEEVQEIRRLCEERKIQLEFLGERPTEAQIKLARSGEIDAAIRELANKQKAILVTADKVESESAKAYGVGVKFFKIRIPKKKLFIEKLFDENTMSVHLKENCFPHGKKGRPGEWKLVKLSEKLLTRKQLQNIAKETVEHSRIEADAFIEIMRQGSTIIQFKNYRVIIVKPPVSDGWEITIVRPLKKLHIEHYELSERLLKRVHEEAKGIIIAGETGSGKSCFAQALAEFYAKTGNIVKTVESPRDLQLSDQITQYSKNFASHTELHDILFLSRPDRVIFDEMRDTGDFNLYIDLRLACSVIGVLHSSSSINAIQRFISRTDVGMIPSIFDTLIFIKNGRIAEVYTLEMKVKVPSGMREADLTRPVIEVRNFLTGNLEYEIYSYGEETVVIPVSAGLKNGRLMMTVEKIERELKKYVSKVRAELVSENIVRIYVPSREIAKIIGRKGKNIDKIERKLGISLEVEEL